jgi:hypothetical protein
LLLVGVLVATGCVNQGFHTLNGATIDKQGMQTLRLEPVWSQKMLDRVPEAQRREFEYALTQIRESAVRVYGNLLNVDSTDPHYVLQTEVTKYRPGSAFLRFLITPVLLGGLGGSYVNVNFGLVDPTSGSRVGEGIVRKANLWGGFVGASITAETQLRQCPEEILDDLEEFYQDR